MKKKKRLIPSLALIIAIGVVVFMPGLGFAECPDGITGYWKLDEFNTTDSTYDDFVAGNDATITTGSPEVIDGALYFNDDDADTVDISPNSAFNWTDSEDFSIELWVKTDGVTESATDVFIGRNDTGTGGTDIQWWIGVYKSSGFAGFRIQDNTGSNYEAGTGDTVDVNDGDWHHLVFVRASGVFTLYVDGSGEAITTDDSSGTLSSGFMSDTGDINIGHLALSTNAFDFTGYISQVAIYGKALDTTTIASHAASRTDYCGGSDAISIYAPYPDNTRAFWSFDVDSTTDVFSGLNNATASGSPTVDTTAGINGALSFDDGTPDLLNISPNSAFNWTNSEDFSIELWVKTDGVTESATDVFIGRNDTGTGGTDIQWWIGVYKSSGFAGFRIQDNTGSNYEAGTGDTVDVNDGDWHHLVFVRASGVFTLYVDGSGEAITTDDSSGTLSSGFMSDTGDINIGHLALSTNAFDFTGYIDEVAIYGKALTSTEISSHYTTGGGSTGGGDSVTSLRPIPTASATTATPTVVGDGSTAVTLDGTGSSTHAEASITDYAWSQTGGTTVSLSDNTAASPTFTAPLIATAETLTFSLTVTASDGQTSAPDTVDVVFTVPTSPTAPTASAGIDQTVTEGDTVTLDASGSTPATTGANLTYAWTQTDSSGLTATLSDATAAQPTFTAPEVTTATALTFQVTVTEAGNTETATDTVTITVNDAASSPTADAGDDQSVSKGATVTLDGSGSTPVTTGATLTYAWTQTDSSGYTVTLDDATAVQPTFTAPSAAATLTFQLTVTEDGVGSANDDVTITVRSSGGGGGGCFIESLRK